MTDLSAIRHFGVLDKPTNYQRFLVARPCLLWPANHRLCATAERVAFPFTIWAMLKPAEDKGGFCCLHRHHRVHASSADRFRAVYGLSEAPESEVVICVETGEWVTWRIKT